MNQPYQIIEELYAHDDWGTYFANRYYFSIQTNKTREEVGFTESKLELEPKEREKLLLENLSAFLHEFIHYIQETSTIAGHATMINNIYMKAAFTNYSSNEISSSISLGANRDSPYVTEFSEAALTNAILDGSNKLEYKMYQILNIETIDEPVSFPASGENGTLRIPEISYRSYENGKPITNKIKLGRFYLYEFLAYEMDQLFEMRWLKLEKIKDPLFRSEYTVGRLLGTYIFPKVVKEVALAAALLALNHIDCGNAYITILKRLASESKNSVDQWLVIDTIKKEVSQLLSNKRKEFYEQQDSYINLFKHRNELTIAYTYIASINKKFYDMRIANPCFELEWMLEKKYDLLLKNAEVCDFIYHFKNGTQGSTEEEFFRDYLVSVLPKETSEALKVLIAFDHYFFSHQGMSTERVENNQKETHCCPFYTCCMTQQRKEHPELCKTRPWRIYEICYPKKQHCWYSLGVMESKATSRKLDTISDQGLDIEK